MKAKKAMRSVCVRALVAAAAVLVVVLVGCTFIPRELQPRDNPDDPGNPANFTVVGVEPASGSASVSLEITWVLTFARELDERVLGEVAITEPEEVWDITNAAIEYDGAAVRVTPNEALAPRTTYTGLVVRKFQSIDGTDMADYEDAEFSFETTNGVDPTFADGGHLVLSQINGPGDEWGQRMAVASNGKLYISGYCAGEGTMDLLVMRLTQDGSLDITFNNAGTAGIAIYDSGGVDMGQGVAETAEGGAIVVGKITEGYNRPAVWRFTAAGDLDPDFADAGLYHHPDGGVLREVALDDAGRAYVLGTTPGADYLLMRMSADGSLDTSFGTDGIVTYDHDEKTNEANSLALQSDGTILCGGYTRTEAGDRDLLVVRFLTDGSLDTSYGTGGVVTHNSAAGGSGDEHAWDIALDEEDNAYVVGFSYTLSNFRAAVIWRITPEGVLDADFGSGGVFAMEATAGGDRDQFLSVCLDGADGIYCSGNASDPGGSYVAFVARLLTDGTVDTSFADGGVLFVDDYNAAAGDISAYSAIALDDEGRIVATGGVPGADDYDLIVSRFR